MQKSLHAPAGPRLGEALEHGGTRLRVVEYVGLVRKAEHWSETHVSGYIDAPRIDSIGGTIQSSGGGGSISSQVHNWMRFYVDVGDGRERVVWAPGTFGAREGHRLLLRYVDSGRSIMLVKAVNMDTGASFATDYDGRDVTGSRIVRRIFAVLTGIVVILGLIAYYARLPLQVREPVTALMT